MHGLSMRTKTYSVLLLQKTNKQTNKQTSKQASKQANARTHAPAPTHKHTTPHHATPRHATPHHTTQHNVTTQHNTSHTHTHTRSAMLRSLLAVVGARRHEVILEGRLPDPGGSAMTSAHKFWGLACNWAGPHLSTQFWTHRSMHRATGGCPLELFEHVEKNNNSKTKQRIQTVCCRLRISASHFGRKRWSIRRHALPTLAGRSGMSEVVRSYAYLGVFFRVRFAYL